jgi:hypothetical protein
MPRQLLEFPELPRHFRKYRIYVIPCNIYFITSLFFPHLTFISILLEDRTVFPQTDQFFKDMFPTDKQNNMADLFQSELLTTMNNLFEQILHPLNLNHYRGLN